MNNTKKTLCYRFLFYGVIAALPLVLIITFWADYIISSSTRDYLYSDINKLPVNKVGLVLGTSQFTTDGQKNLHYHRRLDAVVELLKAGKIKYVLISGDKTGRYYNEPNQMRRDLIKRGVPENIIYRDYAGYRTLDSVLRAQSIFGLSQLTIISQAYHNERALYIAHHNNIDAVAWSAQGTMPLSDYTNQIREILARLLAFVEVTILSRQPHFQDNQVVIGTSPPN